MKKLDKQAKIEFLRKLKALLAEYNASIEVDNPGYEYEGHLTIYATDFRQIAEFNYNEDITVEAIESIIRGIEEEKVL